MPKIWKGFKTAIILIAVAVFWSGAALAGQITMYVTQSLTVQFGLLGSTSYLEPDSAQAKSSVLGLAAYPDDYNYGEDIQSGKPPVTSTVNAPGTTWLKQQSATASWTGNQTLSSEHQLQGWGPGIGASNNGAIEQFADNDSRMTYIVPADGVYTGTVQNNYSGQFKMEQGLGSPNRFYSLEGNNYIEGGFFWEIVGGNYEYKTYKKVLTLYPYNNSYPNDLPDFDQVSSGVLTLDFFQVDLKQGDKVYFYALDSSNYNGATTAPLPPTVLLLAGGGGVALILNRRRGD